jgi:hypothetical protein
MYTSSIWILLTGGTAKELENAYPNKTVKPPMSGDMN